MGQLIEGLLGKLSALKGHETDGTPFSKIDLEHAMDELEKLGYERHGYEYLYNGMTGKRMKAEIFIVPTYYQRLKHIVADKIHGRARGPRTLLTRQPPIGRARDGGLRFGEMERDSCISHGASMFIKERMVDCSAPYITYVCGNCGFFAERKKTKYERSSDKDIYHCRMPECHNSKIHKVKIPYAFKLLLQEMMSMCVAPRIRFRDNVFS